LLNAEKDPQYAGYDKQGNDLSTVSGVNGAAEVDSQDKADDGANGEDHTNVVESGSALGQRNRLRLRINGRKEENVDGSKEPANDCATVIS